MNTHLVALFATSSVLIATPAWATAEICGNGIDDDGNGLTDEGCYPTLSTNVCESPLSCGDTGMVSWSTGSLHYDLPPDISPAVPFGPGIGFRRFYTSMYSPGANPTSVHKTPLGPNWQHTYLTWTYLTGTGTGQKIVLHTSQGRDVLYTYSSNSGGWDYFTPQAGEHVMSLKHNTASPNQFQVQLLTGETLVYNSSGQISEIWDTLPTPNKVLITWDSTTNGNVSTVTDANGRRRLLFGYTSGLMTSMQFQTLASGSWTTQHTTSYVKNGTGGLASVTIGGQLAQQYTYSATGYLTKIADGANNQIAAFTYSSTVNGQVDNISTSRGAVGFDYNSTRTACSGKTALYFNLGNTTSCSVDSDCGTGFLCGGKTGTGSTGSCYQAGRCMTTSAVNGESVVTNIAPLGPGGGSCTGACTDVMAYVWATTSLGKNPAGLLNPAGTEDALGNYTSILYNSNGLPISIGYGDTDADPMNAVNPRAEYIYYDATFPGRIAEIDRPSDLSGSASSCVYNTVTGCAQTVYTYGSNNQLQQVEDFGWSLNSSGATTASIRNPITYTYDSKGRITEIDGSVSGIKTVFDYTFDGNANPNLDAFLGDYKIYSDATHYLQPFLTNYDFWGHPTALKAPDGNFTCDTYDTARGFLASRRHAMNGQTDCTTANSADITETWARDSALRLTQLTRPDGSCLFYSYDSTSRLYQSKRRDDCNASSTGDTQTWNYTADSQVSEIDTYDASGTLAAKQPYSYFNSRRLQALVNPVDTSKFTGLVYDSAGKVTEVDGASNLSKTVYHFDGGPGRDNRASSEERYVTTSTSDTWSLLYSWFHGQSQVTDGDSKVTGSTRDDLNRLVKLTSPDFTNATVRVYDAASRLTTVVEDLGVGTGNQQTHAFTFDNLSRPLNADYQGSCAVTTGTPHAEIQRMYDTFQSGYSCPAAMTGGCNNLSGRLVMVETILMCSTTYQTTDGSLDQFTYYSYDKAGRVVEEYITDDAGRTADHLYQWTKNGALAQVTTPSGAVIGWVFGSTGSNSDTDRVTSMWRTNTSTPIIDTVKWNPFGPLKQYNWEPTVGSLGLMTYIVRNLAYRITFLGNGEASDLSTAYNSVTLKEDAKGRVASRVYTPHDPTTTGLLDSYFLYDEQDRVVCETTNSQTTCPTTGTNIKNNLSAGGFTHAGEWNKVLRPIAGSTNGLTNQFDPSGYGTSHQVTLVRQNDGTPTIGDTAIAYDVRGNRSYDDNTSTLTNDRRDYTYDARRNVVNVRGQYKTGGAWHYYDVASAFDGRNRRVFKSFYDETTAKTATWYFYYDPMNRLSEVRYTPDTSASSTYSSFQLFWLEHRLVLYWQVDYPSVTTSKRYVSTDETGRPYELVNWPSSGNPAVYWGINQNAWGVDNTLKFGAGAIYQPILFAGQYQDAETAAYENDGTTIHRPALALNGFRTYDPFVGAYLQVDPLVDRTRSSYVYADSNTVGESDPSGLMINLCTDKCDMVPDEEYANCLLGCESTDYGGNGSTGGGGPQGGGGESVLPGCDNFGGGYLPGDQWGNGGHDGLGECDSYTWAGAHTDTTGVGETEVPDRCVAIESQMVGYCSRCPTDTTTVRGDPTSGPTDAEGLLGITVPTGPPVKVIWESCIRCKQLRFQLDLCN